MDRCEPTPWPPLGLGSVSILLWSSLTFFLHLPGSVPLNASEIWSIFSSCEVVKTYFCSCYLTQIFGLCPNPCAACWPIMSIPEERNREKPPFGGGFVPYLKTVNCFKGLLWVLFGNKMVTGIKSLPSGITCAGLCISHDYLSIQFQVRSIYHPPDQELTV